MNIFKVISKIWYIVRIKHLLIFAFENKNVDLGVWFFGSLHTKEEKKKLINKRTYNKIV
jgi:hypothetical protein